MFDHRKQRKALKSLSRLAGWLLAHANYHLWKSGELVPLGMTETSSVWSGSTLNITILGVDWPTVPDAVFQWLMINHEKVDRVGVVMDAWITSAGSNDKTAAVVVSVRPSNFSTRLIVCQPYTQGNASTPIVFNQPIIDAPSEHQSVLSDRASILAWVLETRRGPPFIPRGHYKP